jgi:hypothetical protein
VNPCATRSAAFRLLRAAAGQNAPAVPGIARSVKALESFIAARFMLPFKRFFEKQGQ